MATRPSTAAILAAARAADGKPSAEGASNGSVSRLEPIATPQPEEADAAAAAAKAESHPIGKNADASAADAPVERNGSHAAVPPSVATILSRVRGGRESVQEVRPPSITEILAKVRESVGSTSAVPPSVAGMLGEIRHGSGADRPRTAQPPQTAGKTAIAAAAKGRPSTAEILAAARKRATAGVAPASSASETTPQPASRPKTADILAAARRQGSGSASGAATSPPAAPRPKPAARPAKSEATAEAAPEAVGPGDGLQVRPRPAAEILAAVRAEATSVTNGTSADPSLPPLAEMVAALRQLDARSSRHRRQAEPVGWAGRLRRWFADDRDTHRGASI
jgi:hypothetical protein